MSVSVSVERQRPRKVQSVLSSVVFFLTPVITSAIPKVTWLFFPVIALVLLSAAVSPNRERQQSTYWNAALIACILVAAYIFVNASWAADLKTALIKAVLLLAVVMLSFAVSRAISCVDYEQLHDAASAIALGTFVGALLAIFELLTDGAITRLALNSIHLFQTPNHKHVTIHNGEIVKLNPSDLNRNVAILTLGLWSALLAITTLEGGARRYIFSTALLLAVTVAVFLSEHQSSQVALIVSLPIFLLALIWRKAVVRSLAVFWCLTFLLVMPTVFIAYNHQLHMAEWLPSSFRARIIIWEYTAERVFDHPWIGVGADSTRALKEPNTWETAERPAGFIYPRTIGMHAHDLFLQSWFELGVIGVVLMGFAGAAVILRISLLPVEAQPFAAAQFTTFLAIASFGWGMWQTWLICGAALSLTYVLIASHAKRNDDLRTI
jgi:O-antigen ligase